MRSTTRLYGTAIAIVSGCYSVWSAMGAEMLGMWFMLLLGLVVIGHGVVLLSSYADRLKGVSGPLMIAYAALMLGNQAWMELTKPKPMGMDVPASAGADPGMTALAVLMLVSGVIMWWRDGESDGSM